MALFVVCVMWENVTSLMKGARVWEKWAVEETKYPETEEVSSQTNDGSEKGLP